MNSIVLDPGTSARLRAMSEPVELRDEQGQVVVGYFMPGIDPAIYRGLDSDLTEAELKRREQETDSYSTAEVLAYLEQL